MAENRNVMDDHWAERSRYHQPKQHGRKHHSSMPIDAEHEPNLYPHPACNATCQASERHIRLINTTQHYVGGLMWLDDLAPYASIGLNVRDFEMLKADKGVQMLLEQKTLVVEYEGDSPSRL